MSFLYKTTGTCSREIAVELAGNIIKKVEFTGGCNGNLSGIAKIVEGMMVEHVVDKFRGTRCGERATSCPDQLAIAVMEAYKANKN